jgi:hypothetical protein
MSRHDATPTSAAQAAVQAADRLSKHLRTFFAALLRTLDQRLDRRLVSTFLATLIAIVEWRNRNHGFLLSELGAYLLTPEQAPAGAKRLSNLLRSERWQAKLLADWLWQQADARVQTLCASGEEPLLIWDGSILEKPETLQQGAPPQPYPPRLLQPSRRSPNLCAGLELARRAGTGTFGRTHRRGDALVDQAWRAGE